MIDLHIHTCHSDGQYMPKEIIQLSLERGIDTLAITDHDAVSGVDEAVKAGDLLGIKVIPGIEISAMEDQEIHILGYDISTNSPVMKKFVCEAEKKYEDSFEKMLRYFAKYGIEIKKEDIQRYREGKLVTVWHFAKYLVDYGYERSIQNVFKKYFTQVVLTEFKKNRVSVAEAIRIILNSGGYAVLAHPVRYGYTKKELLSRLEKWIADGLTGIEAIYSRNTEDDTAYFCEIAKRYGLKITMGSDFHGPLVNSSILLGTGIRNSIGDDKWNKYVRKRYSFTGNH